MKRFSKKQIVEAISYWNNQLKMLNESNWDDDNNVMIRGCDDVQLMTRGSKTITLFDLLDVCDSWFDFNYKFTNKKMKNLYVHEVRIYIAYACESQNIILFGASLMCSGYKEENGMLNYFDTDGVKYIGAKVSSTGKLVLLDEQEFNKALRSYNLNKGKTDLWKKISLPNEYIATRYLH